MGYPISDEVDAPDGQGKCSYFEGGAICWTAEGGTYVRERKRQNPKPQTPKAPTNNYLTVFYNGYTADGLLTIRNLQTKKTQQQVVYNGKTVFKLSINGGNYELLRDKCPPKSDCFPIYERLQSVSLKKGENKTVQVRERID